MMTENVNNPPVAPHGVEEDDNVLVAANEVPNPVDFEPEFIVDVVPKPPRKKNVRPNVQMPDIIQLAAYGEQLANPGPVDGRRGRHKQRGGKGPSRPRASKNAGLVGTALRDAVDRVKGDEDARRELRVETPKAPKPTLSEVHEEKKIIKNQDNMEEMELLNGFHDGEFDVSGSSFTFYGRNHLLSNLLRVLFLLCFFFAIVTFSHLLHIWVRDGFVHMFQLVHFLFIVPLSILLTTCTVLLPWALEAARRKYCKYKNINPPKTVLFPQIWRLTKKWVVTNVFFESEKYLNEPRLATFKGVLRFDDHRTDTHSKTDMLHANPLFAQYRVTEYNEAGYHVEGDLIVSHELLSQIMTPRNTAGNLSAKDQKERLYNSANTIGSINFRRHQMIKPGYNCSNDTVLFCTFLLEYYRQTREFLPDTSGNQFGEDFRLLHRSVLSH